MASMAAAASTALVNLYAPVASSVAVTVAGSAQTPHGLVQWAQANSTLSASFVSGSISALVGILTIIGVLASLRNSRQNSASDRKHTADEADKDRIATMRREVYLDAVAALVEAQNYLGTLPKRDLAKDNLFEGLLGLQKAVSKIAVVAEQETALKARALSGRYGIFLMKSLRVILPLGVAKSDRGIADSNHTDSRAQVKRVLMELAQMNEQGIKDEVRRHGLNLAFDFHQKWAKVHADATDAANLRMNEAEMAYVKLMREEVTTLAYELDDIACFIRKELSIKTDVQAFHQQTESIQEKMNVAFDEVMVLWGQSYAAHAQRVTEARKAADEGK